MVPRVLCCRESTPLTRSANSDAVRNVGRRLAQADSLPQSAPVASEFGFATIWTSDARGLPSSGNLGVVDDPTRFRRPANAVRKNFGRCLTNA